MGKLDSLSVEFNQFWSSDPISRLKSVSTWVSKMLPGGSKPLLEPILTCHQWRSDAFAWQQFQEKLMNLVRTICSRLHLLLLHCIVTCLSNTLLSSVNIHEGKSHLESLIIFCRNTIYISNAISWSTQLHSKREFTHSNQDHTARHKLRNRRLSDYMKISLIYLSSAVR